MAFGDEKLPPGYRRVQGRPLEGGQSLVSEKGNEIAPVERADEVAYAEFLERCKEKTTMFRNALREAMRDIPQSNGRKVRINIMIRPPYLRTNISQEDKAALRDQPDEDELRMYIHIHADGSLHFTRWHSPRITAALERAFPKSWWARHVIYHELAEKLGSRIKESWNIGTENDMRVCAEQCAEAIRVMQRDYPEIRLKV